ncbi:MAG: biotin/methionine sulfoxide reductase, partial [Gammaproteobacteria bacterium]
GAWYDPQDPTQPNSLCKHGNVNVLTPDIGTSQLGQGPIAHTCMVQIEKFDGELPTLTAFDPPQIISDTQR